MANIRTARRSGLVLRGGRNVRETVWFGQSADSSNTITAPSTAVLVSSLSAAALALRPFTIVRTRGILNLRSDQAAAAELQGCSYGEAVVSDQASAIGITALPTPTTDSASDLWFVYEWIMGNATDLTDLAVGGVSKEVDSRAMRKVEDGEDLIKVVESAAVTNGLIIRQFTRNLIKLH